MQGAANEMIARIDLATGKVSTAGPFPGALTIAAAGVSVWIGHGPADSAANPDAGVLIQLDGTTLREIRRIQLGDRATAPLAAIAGTGKRLWIAYGSTLLQLDPGDGHRLASASLPVPASSISIDPLQTRLYVGGDGCGPNTSGFVTEWDPDSLQRIASAASGGGCLGGPKVSAAKDGVWVSYATGNLGLYEHLRAGDLAVVPSGGSPHSNAIEVFAMGGRVWALDGGAGSLACLDPQTGAELASWDSAGAMTLAGDSNGDFIGNVDGVYVLLIDPRCH